MNAPIHYVEHVVPDVDTACAALAASNGLEFSEPVPALGGARVARLPDGSRVGVRAPMHDVERVVTRVYLLVDDVEASAAAAVEQGAELMVSGMAIPGEGTISIVNIGGVEHGYWQVP